MHRLAVQSHRHAVHGKTQNFGVKLVCHLAGMEVPPGGFWAKTQNYAEIAQPEKGFMQLGSYKAQYIGLD